MPSDATPLSQSDYEGHEEASIVDHGIRWQWEYNPNEIDHHFADQTPPYLSPVPNNATPRSQSDYEGHEEASILDRREAPYGPPEGAPLPKMKIVQRGVNRKKRSHEETIRLDEDDFDESNETFTDRAHPANQVRHRRPPRSNLIQEIQINDRPHTEPMLWPADSANDQPRAKNKKFRLSDGRSASVVDARSANDYGHSPPTYQAASLTSSSRISSPCIGLPLSSSDYPLLEQPALHNLPRASHPRASAGPALQPASRKRTGRGRRRQRHGELVQQLDGSFLFRENGSEEWGE